MLSLLFSPSLFSVSSPLSSSPVPLVLSPHPPLFPPPLLKVPGIMFMLYGYATSSASQPLLLFLTHDLYVCANSSVPLSVPYSLLASFLFFLFLLYRCSRTNALLSSSLGLVQLDVVWERVDVFVLIDAWCLSVCLSHYLCTWVNGTGYCSPVNGEGVFKIQYIH